MILVNVTSVALFVHSLKKNIWPGETILDDSLREKLDKDKSFQKRLDKGFFKLKEGNNTTPIPLTSEENTEVKEPEIDGHIEAAKEIMHHNASEAVRVINLITSVGTLEIIAKEEIRKSVVYAAQARIKALKK